MPGLLISNGSSADIVSFDPAGTISSTTVQAAVQEVDTEKSSLSSPTFTGTPAVPTAAAGTNTTQIASTAYVRSELSYETVSDLTITANATSLALGTANIGYVSSAPGANFTLNVTGVPTTNGQSITVTVFVVQGATGYIPNALQVDGAGQTIKWAGGNAPTPTSSAGKIDIFSFTMIRRSNAWTVFGSMLGNF